MIIITGSVTGTPETIDELLAVKTATALAASPPVLELFTAIPASLPVG
jgi:hypothetical protein